MRPKPETDDDLEMAKPQEEIQNELEVESELTSAVPMEAEEVKSQQSGMTLRSANTATPSTPQKSSCLRIAVQLVVVGQG